MSVFTVSGNKSKLTEIGHAMTGGSSAEVRPMSPSSTFDIFPVVPYEPVTPPENWQDARQWIDDELQRLSAALRNLIDDTASWILYGDCDSVALNTTAAKLVNYEFSGFWSGGQPAQVDPVAGEITIPGSGIYNITATVTGNSSNPRQNDAAALIVDVDGQQGVLSSYEKATQQIDSLTFSGSVTRAYNGGEVISLWLEATNDYGTYDIVSSSFEVRKVTDVPP